MYIAIYARQSIDKENSVSIETQIEYAKATIKPCERELEVKCYTDKGFSGKDTNRPSFKNLMTDIKKGIIKKVIVYKLDRVSRSLIDFVDMINDFKKYGVEFISSQESFDTSSVYGEMICKILMVFAEFERTSIINRIRDTYAKRADLGLYSGGRLPYGYNLIDTSISGIKTKKYIENKDEAEIIKYIFNCYSEDAMTIREILNNLKNFFPLTNWSTSKISTILRNPLYVKADVKIYEYFKKRNAKIIGEIQEFNGNHNLQLYGKTTHNKKFSDMSDMKAVLLESQGIVASDIWLKCQQKLSNNKKTGRAVSGKTSWLSGKVFCSLCGGTMTYIKGTKNNYITCRNKTKKLCSGTTSTLYANEIESVLFKSIANKIKGITVHNENFESDIRNMCKRIEDIDAELNKIDKEMGSTCLSEHIISILNEKKENLNVEKYSLSRDIKKYNDNADLYMIKCTHLLNLWENADFNKKRAVLYLLVNQIKICENSDIEIVWNL